jgi:hypothetical protein
MTTRSGQSYRKEQNENPDDGKSTTTSTSAAMIFNFTTSPKPTLPILLPYIHAIRQRYLTEQKGDKTKIFFGTIKEKNPTNSTVSTTAIDLDLPKLGPSYQKARFVYTFLTIDEAKGFGMNPLLLSQATRGNLVISILDLIGGSHNSFDIGIDTENIDLNQ